MADEVLVDRAELARLRRIEAHVRRYVALLEAEASAQLTGQQDKHASPGVEAPTRSAVVAAQRALREAVRG